MKKSKIIIVVVTALTAVLITVVAVAGFIYVNQQDIAQKNKEYEQHKQLIEYEQTQINKRSDENRTCSGTASSNDSLNEQLKRRSLGC